MNTAYSHLLVFFLISSLSCRHTSLNSKDLRTSPKPLLSDNFRKPVESPEDKKTDLLRSLDEETETLCNDARNLENDPELLKVDTDFKEIAENIAKLDCGLLKEFVKTKEFDGVFAKDELSPFSEKTQPGKFPDISPSDQEIHEKTSIDSKTSPDKTSNSTADQPAGGLANPEGVPRMLLVMSLLGIVTAVRLHTLQGRHKAAVFQWVLSGITLYLSLKTQNKTYSETDQNLVPWIFLLNGVMGAVGAYGLLADGINKARHWGVNSDPDLKKLNYEEFAKIYQSKLKQKNRSVLEKISLDDANIMRYSEEIGMKPQHLKLLVGGAVTGFGVVSAAFAIKQLVMGNEELRNSYRLSGPDSEKTYGEIFGERVNRILFLKHKINSTGSG